MARPKKNTGKKVTKKSKSYETRFADRFKKILRDRGITKHSHTEIARQLGLSTETVRKYFEGISYPHYPAMEKIAEVYGADAIFYLVTGRDPDAMEVSREEEKLILAYRKAEKHERRSVKSILSRIDGSLWY